MNEFDLSSHIQIAPHKITFVNGGAIDAMHGEMGSINLPVKHVVWDPPHSSYEESEKVGFGGPTKAMHAIRSSTTAMDRSPSLFV